MSNRVLQVGGLAVAGGIGYYLYQAGGDPKAAQKRAEADATKISNEVKSTLPGKADEAKKNVGVAAADVRAEADRLARDARQGIDKADAKVLEYKREAEKSLDKTAKETQSTLNSAVDKFDKSVTEGASKAKSGISSWFGSK